MKRFVYIYSNQARNLLHTGISKDIFKTIEFYNTLSKMSLKQEKINSLVYLEDAITENLALTKMKEIMSMNKEEKTAFVRSVNPEWIDITIESLQLQGW